jgi:hypothetical protein
MTIRVNPAVRTLWRNTEQIQFGFPARLQLNEVDEEAQRLIAALTSGVAERETASQARALGVSESAMLAMIKRLEPVLIKTDTLAQPDVDARFAELMRMALVSDDPQALAAARGKLKVFINRLNRFGVTVARGMVASGVGSVVTTDAKHLQPSDSLALGVAQGQNPGKTRYALAREELGGRVQLHSNLRDTTSQEINFAILQANEIISPELYQRWLANDVPHLAVSFDEAGVTVSPVVIPGVTSCLACLSQREISIDPAWVALACQITLQPRDLGDSASLLFAAGVAVHRALSFCDSIASLRQPGEMVGVRLTNEGTIEKIDYAVASCGCSNHQ